MRLPRTLLLICAMVLSIAAANTASGTTLNVYCQEGECRGDSECFTYCCSRYNCDPAWPPFCVKDFQTPSGCGVCFC
jgi:hypothetical protein